jgi:hypothetical protein
LPIVDLFLKTTRAINAATTILMKTYCTGIDLGDRQGAHGAKNGDKKSGNYKMAHSVKYL